MSTTIEKPHLSATQLEMFWRCGEQYRRRYIQGERIPPGVSLILGKAFHAGAETNFRQKIESHQDLPAADIMEATAAAFEAEQAGGYELTEEEASTGHATVLGKAKDTAVQLAGVHAKEQAPDYQPVAVEHATRIIFPNASHDLLTITDLRDDQDRITDFKTAARKMPANAADTSTQLTVYAAAHRIDTGRDATECRLDVLTKTKTPARQVLTTARDVNDFRVLVARVNKTLDAIKAGIFTPCPPGGWACSPKFCGYWATCPYVNQARREAAESAGR